MQSYPAVMSNEAVRIGAGEKPGGSDVVRGQAVGRMFRKDVQVAGERVDRIERGPANDSVVAMGEVGRERVVRIMGEEGGGLDAADGADDVSAKGKGILNLAVRMAQEGDGGDAEEVGGVPGLSFPSRGDFGGVCRRVRSALVAGGHQQEVDCGTLVNRQAECPGAPALDVVRVSRYCEDGSGDRRTNAAGCVHGGMVPGRGNLRSIGIDPHCRGLVPFATTEPDHG